MDKQERLYVGLDESNHGAYPELCLAYFSIIRKDSFVVETPVRRDPNLKSSLQSPRRDYRFLLLEEGNIQPHKNNLAITTPSLIIPYLKEKGPFKALSIFVDGRLDTPDQRHIQRELSDFAEDIEVKGVIKRKRKVKGKKLKVYKQPKVLLFADFQAHHLYTQFSLEQLHYHEKRVAFLA
jgi:hypothetical protein